MIPTVIDAAVGIAIGVTIGVMCDTSVCLTNVDIDYTTLCNEYCYAHCGEHHRPYDDDHHHHYSYHGHHKSEGYSGPG